MRANHNAISLILLGMTLMGLIADCNHIDDAEIPTSQMSLSPVRRSWLEVICSAQALATLVAGQVAATSGSRNRMKYRQARKEQMQASDD